MVLYTYQKLTDDIQWVGVESRREHLLSQLDSPLKTIYAFDFSPESGSISNRRVFIDLNAESFYPDGLTVDREGCIWSHVGRLVYYPV